MNRSEANSMLQIRNLGDEHRNSTETLALEANNKPKTIVNQYYFVKFWPYKDPDEASKIAKSEQLIENLDQKLKQMDQEFKLLKIKWIDTHSELIHLRGRESTISYGLDWQKETLDHLQLASDKLNSLTLPRKHKRRSNHTQGYQSWISHGSSNLVVERKLIKEMATSQHKLNDLGLHIMCYNWGNMDKSRYSQMLEEPKQIEDRKKKNANIFNPLTVKMP
ncbi:hypothetical protein V6N13_047156 [Hibiscus sabdariffa]